MVLDKIYIVTTINANNKAHSYAFSSYEEATKFFDNEEACKKDTHKVFLSTASLDARTKEKAILVYPNSPFYNKVRW